MNYARVTLTCGLLATALAVACNDRPAPTSPSVEGITTGDLGPDGSTLKIGAPTISSPADGAQLQDSPTLVFTNVNGTYATFPVTYEIEIRNPATGAVLNPSPKVAAQGGATTSHTVSSGLEGDTIYSWRVRATAFNSLVGPWSSSRTYKTQPASYLRINEIFDPFTTARTPGTISGPHQFIPGVGLKLLSQTSYVTYELTENLQAGEFSLMATGVDDGSPGDKSKIMSMKEGHSDITTNDYRMTVELRGKNYAIPGSVSCRIITGGGEGTIHDCVRAVVDFSDTRWYFWKFTWQTGSARLEVRADSETGPLLYGHTLGTGGRAYRPIPHLVHVGSPPGRAGDLDQTIGGLIVKNLWFGSKPRPNFPNPSPASVPSLLASPR